MATTTSPAYEELSRGELYDLAQDRDIEGRSQMSKDELVRALRASDLGPDAVELLVEQHEEIRELFEEIGRLSSRASKRKDELVERLITRLVKHAEVEELVFYPAVREALPDLGDDIDEDLEEHHTSELLLWELDKMSSADERFDAKVGVLRELVSHHLEEEERDLFPRVRDALAEQHRRRVGATMVRAYGMAPSRPHPLAPSRPPANLVAGALGSAQDALVGALRAAGRSLRRR